MNRMNKSPEFQTGHRLETFGKPSLCEGGALELA